jgi:hypothetical protein
MATSTAAARGQAKVSQKELNEKFDGLKSILKNIKSSKGKDLYTHLQEVFKNLILHYPDQSLEKLEEVSYLLKNADSYQIEQFLKIADMRNYKDICTQMADYTKMMQAQFGGKAAVDGEEEAEEAAEAAPVGFVPDLLEDANVYQWAGIGFGQ